MTALLGMTKRQRQTRVDTIALSLHESGERPEAASLVKGMTGPVLVLVMYWSPVSRTDQGGSHDRADDVACYIEGGATPRTACLSMQQR